MICADHDAADDGFSLVEIVVSMFLLALLALSFLPLVAQSVRASAGNTTLAIATRLVSEDLELVRARGSVCPVAVPIDLTDPRGVPLRVERVASGCTGQVTYHVTVTRTSTPAKVLAEATTLVWVAP